LSHAFLLRLIFAPIVLVTEVRKSNPLPTALAIAETGSADTPTELAPAELVAPLVTFEKSGGNVPFDIFLSCEL
jgi:hypothetical protein